MRQYVIDAFTDHVFSGNPAAVCIMDSWPADGKMLDIARENNIIMDGRDIGTVVLPKADVKVYLTASTHTRAMRRFLELQEKGQVADLEKIEADIADRDYRDMHRETSPLRQAEDAVLVDSSEMTIEQVVERILSLCR